MKIKANKKTQKESFTFKCKEGEVVFVVRPFPFSQFKFSGTDTLLSADTLWHQFCYCLVSWEGLFDEEDKPLECNEENKRLIFDFYPDLRDFISEKAGSISAEIHRQLKN